MERFDKTSMKKMKLGMTWVFIGVFLFMGSFLSPKVVVAEKKEKVAVLPFRVHALKPLDHLQLGLQEMLIHRLEKRGFSMVSPKVINKHPLAFLSAFEIKELIKLGKVLKAEWIISGSVTQIGEKFSIDLKVVEVNEDRLPFFIFGVADDIDAFADKFKRIAVSIDHKISRVVQVDSVQVKGNQRIEKEAILAVVKIKKGDSLDHEQLNKDLGGIYKMGFFKDVKIETQDGPVGEIVTFIVTEKPSIGQIVFEGNKKVKDDKLRDELGIKLYSILDNNEIRQSINRLKEYYHQKAYYNVDIRDSIESLPKNEVLLKYIIDEHKKVYITKIQFLGNKKYDNDDLKDLMETSEKGFLSWITKSGYLDKKKLEFDVQKINSFYHNHGFINAKVGEPKITFVKDEGLHITIKVHEGHEYTVNKVTVEGDLIIPADKLLEKLQIGKEKIYNREIIRKDISTLKNICGDKGYAYADVTTSTKVNNKDHFVDITYKISKEVKVRFERINIIGNMRTRDKVIRRELKVIEGEYFSGKSIRKSTQNLWRLGYFEDVKVKTKKGSRDDQMILDVEVKERSTGTFSIGAGYSSKDKAFVSASISENNLFGYGQKLQAKGKIGQESDEFSIKFVEPWLFNVNLSGSAEVYQWMYEYDDYTRDSIGGALGLGFPLRIDEYLRGSVKYGYDKANIYDIADDASSVLKDMEGRNVTSSIFFKIRRDSRDRLWNTSRGSINSISFEYAGGFLSGDEYFNKYEAKSAWYFPLFWDTVFLLKGQLGYVEQRSGGKLSVFQKFMIGGMNTVRGFDYDSISPVDPETGDKIGGEKMMVFNVEYRVPLFKEQGVVGLVFFDAGNVFTKDENYTFSGIRDSVGAGIRWYSPMGPLRLEYGKNLDPREGEAAGKWEFSVGGTF
jgi:outer membrane protein insertion porin family